MPPTLGEYFQSLHRVEVSLSTFKKLRVCAYSSKDNAGWPFQIWQGVEDETTLTGPAPFDEVTCLYSKGSSRSQAAKNSLLYLSPVHILND